MRRQLVWRGGAARLEARLYGRQGCLPPRAAGLRRGKRLPGFEGWERSG